MKKELLTAENSGQKDTFIVFALFWVCIYKKVSNWGGVHWNSLFQSVSHLFWDFMFTFQEDKQG